MSLENYVKSIEMAGQESRPKRDGAAQLVTSANH
jgi:hypothetical protein